MIPPDLFECLKKVFCMNFSDEPPYDYIMKSLQHCFEKALNATVPKCPPSMKAAPPQSPKLGNNYVFEWNRTLAKRVRDTLMSD